MRYILKVIIGIAILVAALALGGSVFLLATYGVDGAFRQLFMMPENFELAHALDIWIICLIVSSGLVVRLISTYRKTYGRKPIDRNSLRT